MEGDVKLMINGKVVFITGASSGFGKAIAHELMLKGNRVYGTSRKPCKENARIFPDSSSSNGFIEMIQLDVRSDESIKKAIDYVYGKEGHIDVLINNAGYGVAGAIEDTTYEKTLV